MDFDDPEKVRATGIKVLTGILVLMVVAFAWLSIVVSVPTGHRGILLNFGQAITTLGEGFALKMPFVQDVVMMSVQTQKFDAKSAAASSDLQDVSTVVAVNFHINPESTMTLYRNVGENYQETIIAPAVQEVVKATTAKFTAEQLITKRETVKVQMEAALSERLRKHNIMVDALSISDFAFSPEFTKAIEAKVTAEQESLQAQNVLTRVKIEAEQKVVSAQAEAEAIRLQNEQLNKSQKVLMLRMIEKWDGKLPLVMGGSSIMGLDLVQLQNLSED